MVRRSEDVARELVARAPAGSIRAVFAGGSVGRGEVWARLEGEILAIQSDIDLYVVVADRADQVAVRDAAARAASALPNALDGVVFLRGVDIGVYGLGDLLAQPARPGTVDLREHQRWLYGDRSVLDQLAPESSRTIEKTEALYLIENRAWDVLDAVAMAHSGDARAVERSRVPAAKAVLDVGAAHLIAEARFVSTHAGRMDELRRRTPALLEPRAFAAIEAAEAMRLGLAPATTLDARDALVLLADTWCALAPSILSTPPGKDGSAGTSREAADTAALLAMRCSRGDFFGNYREFVRLRGRVGGSLLAAAAAGVRFATLSPRAALRTHALSRGLLEAARTTAEALAFHAHYVDALAAHVGFDEGDLDPRAHAALRALS